MVARRIQKRTCLSSDTSLVLRERPRPKYYELTNVRPEVLENGAREAVGAPAESILASFRNKHIRSEVDCAVIGVSRDGVGRSVVDNICHLTASISNCHTITICKLRANESPNAARLAHDTRPDLQQGGRADQRELSDVNSESIYDVAFLTSCAPTKSILTALRSHGSFTPANLRGVTFILAKPHHRRLAVEAE
jgi:hypothetical protein